MHTFSPGLRRLKDHHCADTLTVLQNSRLHLLGHTAAVILQHNSELIVFKFLFHCTISSKQQIVVHFGKCRFCAEEGTIGGLCFGIMSLLSR